MLRRKVIVQNEVGLHARPAKNLVSELNKYSSDVYIEKEFERVRNEFRIKERSALQKLYFYNMVYPMVFKYIRTSVLEFQNRTEELEEL